jgi:ABC-type Na+ efflux pump permease subunit
VKRIWLVAAREFLAAVANKGFVFGLLLMPAMAAVVAVLLPRLVSAPAAPVRGQVAVIDPTGVVTDELRAMLAPSAIARRRLDTARRALSDAPGIVRDVAAGSAGAIQRSLGPPPELEVVEREADADVGRERAWLLDESEIRHVALVVVHPDAVVRAPGRAAYGGYDLYVPANLDERVETVIDESLREAMLGARMRTRDLDRAEVDAVMHVGRALSVTVTKENETQTNRGLNRALPFIFAGLLVFGVMIGGQTLLTSTVEEKSSRVIEVLLSAVSPMELMAGKILGQLLVSLLVLALYLGAGMMMLVSFAMFGLIDPWLLLHLFIFFLIAYVVFSSVFGAVGAAVNEMREAQSLMTPVMLALMAPWILAPAIGRDPSSTFSVALSFIPPVNTFAMMIRMASTMPPPMWQVWLTIVIGIASACFATWFAAKVFKVGLLMHGRPPNLATLVRWARAA